MGGGASVEMDAASAGEKSYWLKEMVLSAIRGKKKEEEENKYVDESTLGKAEADQIALFTSWFQQHTPGIVARKNENVYARRFYKEVPPPSLRTYSHATQYTHKHTHTHTHTHAQAHQLTQTQTHTNTHTHTHQHAHMLTHTHTHTHTHDTAIIWL